MVILERIDAPSNREVAYPPEFSSPIFDWIKERNPNCSWGKTSFFEQQDEPLLQGLLSELHAEGKSMILLSLAINSPRHNTNSHGELGKHEVALILDKGKRQIIYKDPWGDLVDFHQGYTKQELAVQPSLATLLQKSFPGFAIVADTSRQQTDNFSCCPITLSNLEYYAQNSKLPENINIAEIRVQHTAILIEKGKIPSDEDIIKGVKLLTDRVLQELVAPDAEQKKLIDDIFIKIAEKKPTQFADIAKDAKKLRVCVGALATFLSKEEVKQQEWVERVIDDRPVISAAAIIQKLKTDEVQQEIAEVISRNTRGRLKMV